MKRALLWTLGIMALLLAAGGFILSRIDTQFVVREIAEATTRATGQPLIFASAPRLSLLPPGVTFGKASWGTDVEKTGMTLSLRGGMAQLELMPLFSGKIVIQEIRLDEPVLEMRARQTATEPQVPGQEHDTAPQAPSDVLPVELGHLRISNGSLRFTAADGSLYTISGLNVTVDNLRRREEAVLHCSLAFDINQSSQKMLAGKLEAAALLRYYAPHLTFRQVRFSLTPEAGLIPVQAGPLTLACEGAIDLQTLAVRLPSCSLSLPQGRLELEGQGSLTPPAFTGKLSLDGAPRKLAALAGLSLKTHPRDALRLQCAVEYDTDSLHLRQIAMQLDDTSASGDASLRFGEPLAVTLALQTGMLHLDHYLPMPEQKAVQKQSVSGSQQPTTDKSVSKVGSDTGQLPDLDMRVALGGIQHGRLVLRDVAFMLKGDKGHYVLSNGKATLDGGGSLKASGEVNLPAESYRLKAIAAGVQIGPLLEALGQSRAVEGVAALDADMRVRGSTAAAMQASLNGKGVVEARDVQLKALSALPQNLPGLTGKGAVPDRFDLVRIPFTAQNGEITAQPITVSSSGLSAKGQARVSLPQQHLNATAQIRTLGMDIPVVAQGPFSNISYGVDPKFAADMARKLPGLLLDAGKATGGAARDGAQGAGQGAGDALRKGLEGAGGLVRGLLGR